MDAATDTDLLSIDNVHRCAPTSLIHMSCSLKLVYHIGAMMYRGFWRLFRDLITMEIEVVEVLQNCFLTFTQIGNESDRKQNILQPVSLKCN